MPGLKLDPKECGTNSEAAILLCLNRKLILVVGSKYAGEMKKSVFSLMNYLLPQKGVLGMHCSANMALDDSGDTALFFGLSGRAKPLCPPTPSADLSATTSTAGRTTVYSISRAAAMPSASI